LVLMDSLLAIIHKSKKCLLNISQLHYKLCKETNQLQQCLPQVLICSWFHQDNQCLSILLLQKWVSKIIPFQWTDSMMLLLEFFLLSLPWVWSKSVTQNINLKFLINSQNTPQVNIRTHSMLFMNRWFSSRTKTSSQPKLQNSSTSSSSARKSSTSTTWPNTNSSSTTTTSACNQEAGPVVGKDSKATHSGKATTRKTPMLHPSWTVSRT